MGCQESSLLEMLLIRNENSAQRGSFRPDIPADIPPKTSVRPSKSWKNKHFGTDTTRGRPWKNSGLKNFGLIFRSLSEFQDHSADQRSELEKINEDGDHGVWAPLWSSWPLHRAISRCYRYDTHPAAKGGRQKGIGKNVTKNVKKRDKIVTKRWPKPKKNDLSPFASPLLRHSEIPSKTPNVGAGACGIRGHREEAQRPLHETMRRVEAQLVRRALGGSMPS